MKYCMLLSLLVLGCVHGVPLAQDGMEQGSCEDASAKGAADLALNKINKDRLEGYIFALHRLSNVHTAKHGENGIVFYLTLDVVETNCSVHSMKDWKACEARPTSNTPVYGQCQAAIFINKVDRVNRLYKYNCVVRPVPSVRVHAICPDCPSLLSLDDRKVQDIVIRSLDKFNEDNGLSKRFALLKITRASAGMAMHMYYNVEFAIQETVCTKTAGAADPCPLLECEFSHKGFCRASIYTSQSGGKDESVECEIYEPEVAEREKELHLLAEAAYRQLNDTQPASQAHDHAHAHAHDHDHVHIHHHDHAHDHAHDHDHAHGHAHDHAHNHGHDHGHAHDHDHTQIHHARAHDHSADFPHQHHNYNHSAGVHDHVLARDHEHNHTHLHAHEHYHHHNDQVQEIPPKDNPEGTVVVLLSMDQPMILPAFPDVPAGDAITLTLKPDPKIPGQMEPVIQPFPKAASANCSPAVKGETLVEQLFSEDPLFAKAA